MERNQFLNRIRKALGKSRPPLEKVDSATAARVLAAVAGRGSARRRELHEVLQASARELNIILHFCKTADEAGRTVVQIVETGEPEWGPDRPVVAWDHPLIEQLGLEKRLTAIGAGYHITPNCMAEESEVQASGRDFRQQTVGAAARALVGVTAVDYCLADTATLVMKTRPGQARSTSLLPSIHVAVVKQEQILADFKELCYLLSFDEHQRHEGLTNCLTLISGPSKTADIEAVMVEGAHGPRALHLCVII